MLPGYALCGGKTEVGATPIQRKELGPISKD